tara:strand:- start:21 stop:257 length:237 start_codon:yes stop_codon:yes gene_type:complete
MMNRSTFITTSMGASVALPLTAKKSKPLKNNPTPANLAWQKGRSFWPIYLDTATLDQGIGIEEKLRLAAEAGFNCVEP